MPDCKKCSSSTACCCKSSKHNPSEHVFHIKNLTPTNRQLKQSPLERHLYFRITPDKRRSALQQNSLCSPLQIISETSSQMETSYTSRESCTPLKGYSQTSVNPFDIEIDNLHLPSFSPSVFATIRTKETPEGKSFRWSIEQLAVLKPADIDETSQQSESVTAEEEIKAQSAIDAYFSQRHIVPSPWGPTTANHMAFSPHLASTACFPRGEDLNRSPKMECSLVNAHAKDVSTQTMVTVPPGVNLMALLSQFCTYQDDQIRSDSSSDSSSDGCVFSTSTLRRKLFVNEDDASTSSRLEEDKPESKSSPKCVTPKKLAEWNTPGSDQFSSSPITPRNCSVSTNCAGISMSSPSISPICGSSAKSQRTGSILRFTRRTVCSWKKRVIQDQCSPPLRNSGTKKMEGECSTLESENHGILAPGDKKEDLLSHGDKEQCHSTQDNTAHMESIEASDNRPLSITDSCSQQQDTGYQTSSVNSMVSLSSMSNVQFHATPATEIIDCCMISHSNIVPCEELAESEMSLDRSEFFADDSALSEMAISHESRDQNLHMSACFNSLKWRQNVCSTPTKDVQFHQPC